MSLLPPTAEVIESIVGSGTSFITSRAALYEADGTTVFQEYVPVAGGSVSVDMSRDERRSFDLVIENVDRGLVHPGNFDYDKIVKLYRGIVLPDGTEWEQQLGEFMIDQITTKHFPHTISISGRDYTKKLLKDKFPYAITFSAGKRVEALVKAIALNAGITKFNLPITGRATTRDHTFDRGTPRWNVIKEVSQAYNYDAFFDATGHLTMVPFQDPLSAGSLFTFKTGEGGTLKGYTRRTTDDRIYNHVAVTGTGEDIQVFAQAENNDPNSPTSIARIGRRTYEFVSQFFTSNQQCQDTANRMLKIHALEVYELSLDSLVLPWMEAGYVVRFEDPQASPGAPDRFLLTDFEIPLRLGSMPCSAKRIVSLADTATPPSPTGPPPPPSGWDPGSSTRKERIVDWDWWRHDTREGGPYG